MRVNPVHYHPLRSRCPKNSQAWFFTQQPSTVDELPEICMAAVFHDEEDSISVDDHFVYLHQTSLNRHALDNV